MDNFYIFFVFLCVLQSGEPCVWHRAVPHLILFYFGIYSFLYFSVFYEVLSLASSGDRMSPQSPILYFHKSVFLYLLYISVFLYFCVFCKVSSLASSGDRMSSYSPNFILLHFIIQYFSVFIYFCILCVLQSVQSSVWQRVSPSSPTL